MEMVWVLSEAAPDRIYVFSNREAAEITRRRFGGTIHTEQVWANAEE